MKTSARSGYTLPVFACAAAIAAYKKLSQPDSISAVLVNLIRPDEVVSIPIEQVATLKTHSALAITRSDPGDNLDLTRQTPIWAYVEMAPTAQVCPILIEGGEGLGRRFNPETNCTEAAIYQYASELLITNLQAVMAEGERIKVTLVLPMGRALAQRTSNEAFGVVDGLALLGTTGISHPLSAPQQLEQFQETLHRQAKQYQRLVFCLGENGLDIARNIGIPDPQLLKTANWLGPMLVSAAQAGITELLLLGYHGKLIKLAGGIFHTHHHLADARQEILTAIAASQGMQSPHLQALLQSDTVEAGLSYLRHLDKSDGSQWVDVVYKAVTQRIEQRSQLYIQTHSEKRLEVGCLLFNRQREIFAAGATGQSILSRILATAQDMP